LIDVAHQGEAVAIGFHRNAPVMAHQKWPFLPFLKIITHSFFQLIVASSYEISGRVEETGEREFINS
jgi:hypothetical protein